MRISLPDWAAWFTGAKVPFSAMATRDKFLEWRSWKAGSGRMQCGKARWWGPMGLETSTGGLLEWQFPVLCLPWNKHGARRCDAQALGLEIIRTVLTLWHDVAPKKLLISFNFKFFICKMEIIKLHRAIVRSQCSYGFIGTSKMSGCHGCSVNCGYCYCSVIVIVLGAVIVG